MIDSPSRYIDHTLLSPLSTIAAIELLCEEAVEFGFKGICVPPCHVRSAVARVYGSDIEIATVIGFPLGFETAAVKVFASSEAVSLGATEIDLAISQGLAGDGQLVAVGQEISQVVRAVTPVPVKVIIECCHLNDKRKRDVVEMLVDAGAAMVKTSTGTAVSGATLADVELLASCARGRIGVKAAGGIRDWDFCRQLLEAGATRIGTSAGPEIVRQWQVAEGFEA